jgi:hypothetical protein
LAPLRKVVATPLAKLALFYCNMKLFFHSRSCTSITLHTTLGLYVFPSYNLFLPLVFIHRATGREGRKALWPPSYRCLLSAPCHLFFLLRMEGIKVAISNEKGLLFYLKRRLFKYNSSPFSFEIATFIPSIVPLFLSF